MCMKSNNHQGYQQPISVSSVPHRPGEHGVDWHMAPAISNVLWREVSHDNGNIITQRELCK